MHGYGRENIYAHLWNSSHFNSLELAYQNLIFFLLLVSQCMSVIGPLPGFADDFGRNYLSISDAMKRCKEGMKNFVCFWIYEYHITDILQHLLS